MKNVLQLLFADPDLVTRDLVNDVLAYKRLDGVDEALRTVADRVFPGRRQAKVLNLSGSDVPILAVWGSEDDIVPASTPITCPTTLASISSTARASVQMEAAGMVNRLVADFLRVRSPEQRPVTGSVTVGVIANPASGRDIRRLVAGASVFDNVEKGNMVYRFMVGLGAVSVERVLMMPAASGLYDGLQRALHGHAFERRPLPELELVEMRLRHDARDTVEAVEKMRKQGVKAIAVLEATARIASSPADARIRPSAPSRPVPTTPSPRCAKLPSQDSPPGWSPPGWSLTVSCGGRRFCALGLTATPITTAPWLTSRSAPNASSEPERCGRAVRSRSYS